MGRRRRKRKKKSNNNKLIFESNQDGTASRYNYIHSKHSVYTIGNSTSLPDVKSKKIISDADNIKRLEDEIGELIHDTQRRDMARILMSLRCAQCQNLISLSEVLDSLDALNKIIKNSLYILKSEHRSETFEGVESTPRPTRSV